MLSSFCLTRKTEKEAVVEGIHTSSRIIFCCRYPTWKGNTFKIAIITYLTYEKEINTLTTMTITTTTTTFYADLSTWWGNSDK